MFDIRTKILGFISLLVLSLIFNHPGYNLILAVVMGVVAVFARLPIKKLYQLFLPLLPIFGFIMLFSGFTYGSSQFQGQLSQTTLFYLLPKGRLGFNLGGVLLGCTFLLRLITMVLASAVFTMTTPIDELLQFLQKLKVPYEIAFMLTTAIRFIPTMNQKRLMIMEAQQARGLNFQQKGLLGQIKAYIPIMIPLMTNSILMANTMSMGMMNRGFGLTRSWTSIRPIVMRPRDYGACLLITLATLFGLYLRYGLQQGKL